MLDALLNLHEACQAILKSPLRQLGYERIPFMNAMHRTSFEDVYAKFSSPSHDVSSMDGYAFCYKDKNLLLEEGLILLDEKKIHHLPDPIKPGHARKVFTGGIMPGRSDSVVILEDVEVINHKIRLKKGSALPKKFDWIREKGSSFKEKDLLLKRKTKLGAAEIGLLAQNHCFFINVYQKAKVGILTTGDEIVEIGNLTNPAQTIGINSHILSAMVNDFPATCILKENQKDEFFSTHYVGDKAQTAQERISSLEKNFLYLLLECDFILTTGGMSKGDFDLTQEVIKKYCNVVFHGVCVKPGKPTLFGLSKDGKVPVLGLPGNPNASTLMFHIFGKMILNKLMGIESYPEIFKAKALTKIKKSGDRLELRSCKLQVQDGEYVISDDPKKQHFSANIHNLCDRVALCVLPEDGKDIQEGEYAQIILLT